MVQPILQTNKPHELPCRVVQRPAQHQIVSAIPTLGVFANVTGNSPIINDPTNG